MAIKSQFLKNNLEHISNDNLFMERDKIKLDHYLTQENKSLKISLSIITL